MRSDLGHVSVLNSQVAPGVLLDSYFMLRSAGSCGRRFAAGLWVGVWGSFISLHVSEFVSSRSKVK